MSLGPRPLSALLALVLAFPAAARGPAADFDGRAGVAALLPGLPGPFIPAPKAPSAPRVVPLAPAVPTVRFKGEAFKAVQFSRSTRIPETIAALLDRTERSALLALYQLKLPAVTDAIIRAKRRGVDVRVVFDHGHAGVPAGDTGSGAARSADLQRVLDAGVEVRVLKGRSSYGIMHHKTAVLDGELVIAGSFNWTTAADERNFENLVLRDDPGVVALFDANWRWMWKAAKPLAAAAAADEEADAQAAAATPGDETRPISFNGGAYPRVGFSPLGGVEPLLLDAIGRARRTIDVAIFSFYSKPVAQALVEAKARGVRVRVAADSGQARRSEAVRLLRAGRVELRLSEGREKGFSVMHHKYLVLDGRFVIGGSYNFSINAEQNNHENVLFSTDPGEVAAFLGEQTFVFAQSSVPTDADLPPLQ